MRHLDSRSIWAGASLLACTLVLNACNDGPTGADASRLDPSNASLRATVSVTTGTVKKVTVVATSGVVNGSLAIGASGQMSATAYDSANRIITGRRVIYRSTNTRVVAIDTMTGAIKGVAAGTVQIYAKIDAVTGKSANIVVGSTPVVPSQTVARVVVAPVSGALDTLTWNIAQGGAEQYTATAYDATGAVVSAVAPKYTSSNTAVVKVDSVTGTAQALTAGTATIWATMNGVTGAAHVITVAQTPTAPPAPPATAGSININVVRFDGGSGAATVSSGIPLTQGTLKPGQENLVRVTVGGVEQAAYVTGLSSLHPDGSLRAVLVQFKLTSLPSTGATGRIDLTTTRPANMTLATALATPGAAVANTPLGLPQAAALPSDPNYLVTTDLVGPTTTTAATNTLGGVWARYESNFVTFSTMHWTAENYDWNGNYYDRALIYYAMWARTGNPVYWQRAGQIAYDYRVKYLEANNYGASPHWSQLEGLEKHYLMTGDDMSRTAVAKTARVLVGFIPSNYMTGASGESRIAARVLHAQLLAWRLSTPTSGAGGNTAAYWGSQVEAAYAKIVAWQAANGSFPATAICGGQLNYMVGLQNDALIKLYDYYQPTTMTRSAMQSQIRGIVQKAVDYMWNTQWLTANKAFNYATVDCVSKGVGGPTPAPDLNLLIAAGYAWVYRQTGNAAYQSEADQIFTGGVTQAYLNGTKQFNENYTSSFRYLAYR